MNAHVLSGTSIYKLRPSPAAYVWVFLLFDAVTQRVEFLEPILQQYTVFIAPLARGHIQMSAM